MRKRIVSVFAVICVVAVIFSGCNALTFNSPENLIRPPKLSGEDGELQAAFEKAVSEQGEYILKYPSGGEYRSAFVRHDCDGDGADEAFVFYSLKSEEMSVYMYMLDFVDGEWIPQGALPGDGIDVHSIEFCDLNSDGVDEIFIGWNPLDSKANKKLAVYCAQEDKKTLSYNVLAIESYTAMYTVDIDSDGEKEILLALINSTSDTYTTQARLLKMTQTGSSYQIASVGQVNLYSGITSINAITAGLSGGRRYIYIDETAGDSYLTEMLYWDNTQNILSSAMQLDTVSVAEFPTSRSLNLVCTDINKDGELEIPVTHLLPDSEVIRKNLTENDVIQSNESVYVTCWTEFDEGRFSPVKSYIRNEDDGFTIEYDEEKMADWVVKFFPDDGISQFFLKKKSADPQTENENVLLFTINAVEVNEDVSIGSFLAASETHKYTYEITEEGKNQGIGRNELSALFSIED